MDYINIIAAIVTVAAFVFAIWQYIDSRHRAATERERIAMQRERLRGASSTAVACAEAANLIVQRGKNSDATTVELQNIARVLRGSLLLLGRELDREDHILGIWEFGKRLTISDVEPMNRQTDE